MAEEIVEYEGLMQRPEELSRGKTDGEKAKPENKSLEQVVEIPFYCRMTREEFEKYQQERLAESKRRVIVAIEDAIAAGNNYNDLRRVGMDEKKLLEYGFRVGKKGRIEKIADADMVAAQAFDLNGDGTPDKVVANGCEYLRKGFRQEHETNQASATLGDGRTRELPGDNSTSKEKRKERISDEELFGWFYDTDLPEEVRLKMLERVQATRGKELREIASGRYGPKAAFIAIQKLDEEELRTLRYCSGVLVEDQIKILAERSPTKFYYLLWPNVFYSDEPRPILDVCEETDCAFFDKLSLAQLVELRDNFRKRREWAGERWEPVLLKIYPRIYEAIERTIKKKKIEKANELLEEEK